MMKSNQRELQTCLSQAGQQTRKNLPESPFSLSCIPGVPKPQLLILCMTAADRKATDKNHAIRPWLRYRKYSNTMSGHTWTQLFAMASWICQERFSTVRRETVTVPTEYYIPLFHQPSTFHSIFSCISTDFILPSF